MADKDFMDSLRTGQLVEDGDQPWQWYSPSEYAVKPRTKAKIDHREQACAALRRLIKNLKTTCIFRRLALHNPELLDLSPNAVKIYTVLAQGFDPEWKSKSAKRYRDQVFETAENRKARQDEVAAKGKIYRERHRERHKENCKFYRENRSKTQVERERVQGRKYKTTEAGKIKRNGQRQRRRAGMTGERRQMFLASKRESYMRRRDRQRAFCSIPDQDDDCTWDE